MGEETTLLLSINDKEPAKRFPSCYFPRRYIIVFMCFIGLVLCYSYRVILSVAIIPMATEYQYDKPTRALILSSFFWGYIFTQMPAGFLCNKFGGKAVLGVGIALAGVFTMLTPFVSFSLPLLLACRFVTGVVEGVAYPTVHWLMANWAHEHERSRFVTVTWGGAYIGTVASMLISPVLIKLFSWRFLFYASGALGIVWFFFWMLLAASSPREHWFINESEVRYLAPRADRVKVPTLSLVDLGMLLRSVHVWAIIANHFGSNWGFYILLTWLPTYMTNVLNFDMNKSSFLSVLPFLTMAVTAAIGGQLADFLLTYKLSRVPIGEKGELSEKQIEALASRKTVVRKLFGVVGLLLPALSFVAVNYVKNAYVAVGCVVIALGGTGLAISGYGVNHLDVAPQYAGVLMGLSNTAATIPGIVGVYLVGIMTWPEVFFVGAGVYAASMLIWFFFATGRQIFA